MRDGVNTKFEEPMIQLAHAAPRPEQNKYRPAADVVDEDGGGVDDAGCGAVPHTTLCDAGRKTSWSCVMMLREH